jgi:hypothetical protein
MFGYFRRRRERKEAERKATEAKTRESLAAMESIVAMIGNDPDDTALGAILDEIDVDGTANPVEQPNHPQQTQYHVPLGSHVAPPTTQPSAATEPVERSEPSHSHAESSSHSNVSHSDYSHHDTSSYSHFDSSSFSSHHHWHMAQEIEAKFHLNDEDVDTVLDNLQRLNAHCQYWREEVNVFYDTPKRKLDKRDEILRLRCERSLMTGDEVTVMTFKGSLNL